MLLFHRVSQRRSGIWKRCYLQTFKQFKHLSLKSQSVKIKRTRLSQRELQLKIIMSSQTTISPEISPKMTPLCAQRMISFDYELAQITAFAKLLPLDCHRLVTSLRAAPPPLPASIIPQPAVLPSGMPPLEPGMPWKQHEHSSHEYRQILEACPQSQSSPAISHEALLDALLLCLPLMNRL